MSPPIDSPRNISIITDNDFCISCGACEPACPYDTIEISFVAKKGAFEPEVTDSAKCVGCFDKPCLRVCPSYEVDYGACYKWDRAGSAIGPLVSVYTGQSTNTERNLEASSGGVIKSLSAYLLEKGFVDGVVALVHINGLQYEPRLITSVSDIDATPGSVYHNTTFLQSIEILRKNEGRFLVVGIPCQITGILNHINRNESELRSKIFGIVGLICGWMFSYHTLWSFASYNGIRPEEIKGISYRGEGKVGDLVIETSSGRERFTRRPKLAHGRHYLNYRTSFGRTLNMKRCHYCVEHLNFGADLSVGDAWLKRFSGDSLGTSILITRSQRFDGIIRSMEQDGWLSLEPGSVADVEESQSPDLAYGVTARALNADTRARGAFAPRFRLPVVGSGKGQPKLARTVYYHYANVVRRLLRLRVYWGVRLLKVIEITSDLGIKAIRKLVHLSAGKG